MTRPRLSAIALALVAGSATAQQQFTRIAKTGEQAPGFPAGWLLDRFGSGDGDISDGVAAFGATAAFNGERLEAIYASSGGVLTRLAVTGMTAPNGTVFTSFGDVSVDDGRVAFNANGPTGLFAAPAGGGALETILDLSSPVVATSGRTIASVSTLNTSGDLTIIGASDTPLGRDGIYLVDANQPGQLTAVMESAVPIPQLGGDTLQSLGRPFIRDGRMIFEGEAQDDAALFADFDDGLGLRLLARQGEAAPGGRGAYRFLGGTSIDGDLAAFEADVEVGPRESIDLAMVYDNATDEFEVVAETGDRPYGSSRILNSIFDISIRGGTVLFDSNDASFRRGVYVARDGRVVKVIEEGDLLDGGMVDRASVGDGGSIDLDDTVVFAATLVNDDQGTYTSAVRFPCSDVDYAFPFGVISQADVADFVSRFFENDRYVARLAAPADVVSQADVAEFVNRFFIGCPAI
ncbi:MAG: hypothetical protein AAFR38_06520 [Planctomycetota bacterium]